MFRCGWKITKEIIDENINYFFTVLLITGCTKRENVYLEKLNMFGEWERTAVMFGYYDNYEGCEEIKNAVISKYPNINYRCIPANNAWFSFIFNAVKK